ncbi:MAG: transglycosylase SLT domain-containing protein, partial [Muribaculum sp.]|nr:transglycosylase SLT domain-containing protein [Muribaculum sp.]
GKDNGIVIDLEVAPSLSALIEMMDSGKIDVAAYEIPITAEYRSHVVHCGTENITHQVLVQPKKGPDERITDVTQLVGKEIYVEKDSKYQHRLNNLNDEIGGGIIIHTVAEDTLITEDLIEMVSTGKIPLTVVDSDIAQLNKTYYNSLDIGMEISFPQRSSWGVTPGKEWLADSIDSWFADSEPQSMQARLLKRYFELSKENPVYNIDLSKGRISPYDNLFKKYALQIDWDWRILASQGYTESHFDSTVVSWAGARGIMQIMPRTASAYGLPSSQITNPEANIKTAVAILKDLDKSLTKHVPDTEERRKFVLAAYNSGIAHIYDAIALAKKYGKNPQVWSGNVEEALLMKANPEYYNDPVCKFGYFRGRQTTQYVIKVLDFYERCQKQVSS